MGDGQTNVNDTCWSWFPANREEPLNLVATKMVSWNVSLQSLNISSSCCVLSTGDEWEISSMWIHLDRFGQFGYLKMPKTCCHPKALDFVFVVKTDEIPTDCWLGVATTRVRAVDAGMSIPGDVGRPDSLAEGRAGTPLCRIFVYRLLSSNMVGKS